jgi:hypothetical protein
MIGYVKTTDGGRNKGKRYLCAECGLPVAESGSLFKINGTHEHSYTNPAGVRCNFLTFLSCENILVDEELYREHSWFPAYGWRFLICRGCMNHLGWKYDALAEGVTPPEFFGVLADAVKVVPAGG